MNNPLIIGLDVHRKSHTVHMMNREGQALVSGANLPNDYPGAETFVGQIAAYLKSGDFDGVQLAAEATGWYWWHLFRTLDQSPFLQEEQVELYPLNPRLTANFKKSYSDLGHTDQVDAFVVADRLRMGRDLPPPYHYEETYLPLRFLTRYRCYLVHTLVREKSAYLTHLYLKASNYTHPQKRPFSDAFGKASRAVIEEWSSLEAIAALPFDELVEFIDVNGKRHFPDPTDKARKLLQVVEESYPLPPALQAPIQLILSFSGQRITSLQYQLKRLDRAIVQHLAQLPHSLETIPGFGPVFSAGIIAEIGDLARFEFDQAKVARYAGLVWHRRQSADFYADHSHLSRSGNRYLRYYFCEAANSVRLHDAHYRSYYHKKYHEVRSHQHKRAIVLTARKLVRLVVRLLTSNQPYQPRRC